MAEEVKNTEVEQEKKGNAVWVEFERGDFKETKLNPRKEGNKVYDVSLYTKETGKIHRNFELSEKQIQNHGGKVAIPVYEGETTWQKRALEDGKFVVKESFKLTGEQVKEAAKATLEERKAYRAEQKGEKAAAEAPAKDAAEKPAKEKYSEFVNFIPNGMIHETKKKGRLSVGLNQPDGTVANIFISESQIVKRGEKTSNIRVYNEADKEAVAGYKSYQAARSEEYKKNNLDAKIAAAGEQVKEAAADAPTPEKAKNGQEL